MTVDAWQIAVAFAQHVELTLLALGVAIPIGVALGALLERSRFLAAPVLATVGACQTIPSVALLGFLVPVLGIGARPAIVALFLYALLPIVQNTFTGLSQVSAATIEAARGLGLHEGEILRFVILPQSAPVLIAGVRTATVHSVGVATLSALVGGGGLGTFIFRGISMLDTPLVLAGAIPTAALALALDGLLAMAQRRLDPARKR